MSVAYTGVGWNRTKRVYDLVLIGGVALYLGAFVAIGVLAPAPGHGVSAPILLMRALGTCAIVMLHIVLAIGPMARLDRRFLPLLYNRRHFGVLTFLIGALHALVAVGFYHGFGKVFPLVSVFESNPRYGSFIWFPFETLGAIALAILFLMAATSHDFWLNNLGPRAWKSLHMLVYVAYGLLVMHIVLGALQLEKSPVYAALLGGGALALTILHLLAGGRETARDRSDRSSPVADGGGGTSEASAGGGSADTQWLDAGPISDIPDNRATVLCPPNAERIAVFRYDGKVSAVANVCAHQMGPLGEGRIIDGCITCPWHGYQYRPADGCAPPPFTEKLPTYQVRIVAGRVQVNPTPLPPGTPVEPVRIPEPPDPEAAHG